jgi:hypothetical protein
MRLLLMRYVISLLCGRRWGIKKSGFGKVYQDMGLEFVNIKSMSDDMMICV